MLVIFSLKSSNSLCRLITLTVNSLIKFYLPTDLRTRASVLSTDIIFTNSDDGIGRDVAGAQSRVQLFESACIKAKSGKQSHCRPVSAGSRQAAVNSWRKGASFTNTGLSSSVVFFNVAKVV